MTIESTAALFVCGIACATDLGSRRVPNWLTFGAAAAALGFHILAHGFAGAGSALLGWVVGVALFLPLFVLGGMGGGDVKLMGAVGAWLGGMAVVHVALYGAIAGGVMALVIALAEGYLRTALSNLRTMVTSWFLGVVHAPGLTLADSKGPRLAYALPIAAGTILTLWLQ